MPVLDYYTTDSPICHWTKNEWKMIIFTMRNYIDTKNRIAVQMGYDISVYHFGQLSIAEMP